MTTSPWKDARGKRTGSGRGWRVLRYFILRRDKYICQLCKLPINPNLPANHPDAAQVHHLVGGAAGNDPRYLVAAHRSCNLKAGEPGKTDPQPRGATRWQ